MLKSNPLRINVPCWTCSHLLFDEFPLFKNPWIFSLGFLFEPRLIAGRVGFRVSDGVSGWSQRNLNCVFWSWDDLPGGGKNPQSGQGAILLTERMNVRPTWSTRLWTSSLIEVCRSRDDHWVLEVAPSSDIGCQSFFARKLCICQNELFYRYLQSLLRRQSKEWIKIQLSPYPHDILGSQLIPFEHHRKMVGSEMRIVALPMIKTCHGTRRSAECIELNLRWKAQRWPILKWPKWFLWIFMAIMIDHRTSTILILMSLSFVIFVWPLRKWETFISWRNKSNITCVSPIVPG